jgi:hypothetical protein
LNSFGCPYVKSFTGMNLYENKMLQLYTYKFILVYKCIFNLKNTLLWESKASLKESPDQQESQTEVKEITRIRLVTLLRSSLQKARSGSRMIKR